MRRKRHKFNKDIVIYHRFEKGKYQLKPQFGLGQYFSHVISLADIYAWDTKICSFISKSIDGASEPISHFTGYSLILLVLHTMIVANVFFLNFLFILILNDLVCFIHWKEYNYWPESNANLRLVWSELGVTNIDIFCSFGEKIEIFFLYTLMEAQRFTQFYDHNETVCFISLDYYFESCYIGFVIVRRTF